MKKTVKPKLKLESTRVRPLTQTEQAGVVGGDGVPKSIDGLVAVVKAFG